MIKSDLKLVHMSHCYQGEYAITCKYGEKDCPAKPKKIAKKKTIDKKEFLKSISRDIKIMREDLRKSQPDTHSYKAGELNTFEWFKRWVEADMGDC